MSDRSILHKAAAETRRQHGPEHERHEMWAAMADLLEAENRIDWAGCTEQARRVAWEYLNATTEPGGDVGRTPGNGNEEDE